jgi:alpha-tubulin suppressor-like RCC1 family protein
MTMDESIRHGNLRVGALTVLCAAFAPMVTIAGPPQLQSIAVTPAHASIAVGQMQSFVATGTYSNGAVKALGPDISNIGLGMSHSCAVLTSGGAECWGENSSGQLGNGTTAGASVVPQPVKGITNAVRVAGGSHHSCALLGSGALRCWGDNTSGALGDGTTNDSTVPVTVKNISTAVAISAGSTAANEDVSCALLASGSVECWGDNQFHQLGTYPGAQSSLPVAIGGISTATAATINGGFYGCALLASGAIKCWGHNYQGTLGNGSTNDSATPVNVVGISTATALASGRYSTCAVLANGTVQCWGSNLDGQLGDGTNESYSSVPVTVTGISTAISITAGGYHHCAGLRNGAVKCWGLNVSGELGDGTRADSSTPVRVRATTGPIKIASGNDFSCVLYSSGEMKCWGYNGFGQLGNRRLGGDALTPVRVVGTPGVVWTSNDQGKATITDRGLATGRGAGNATITATTAGLINDNAVLTVQ